MENLSTELVGEQQFGIRPLKQGDEEEEVVGVHFHIHICIYMDSLPSGVMCIIDQLIFPWR